MMKISVLMSVYKNDNPYHFEESLLSIWDCQIFKPFEIVLIQDGPVSVSLEKIILKWKKKLNSVLVFIANESNIGLTKSLNKGIKLCSGDLIARMDADDISLPNRFKIQSEFLKNNSKIDLIGSYLQEFNKLGDLSLIRKYPLNFYEIKKNIHRSSPMCHASVMFRKSIFVNGNQYNEKYKTSQDIALWFDLLNKGYQFANIDTVLYKARLSDDFYKRRSYKKALNEFEIYWNGIIMLFGYSYKLIFPFFRLLLRMMPSSITKFIYYSNFRKILNS